MELTGGANPEVFTAGISKTSAIFVRGMGVGGIKLKKYFYISAARKFILR